MHFQWSCVSRFEPAPWLDLHLMTHVRVLATDSGELLGLPLTTTLARAARVWPLLLFLHPTWASRSPSLWMTFAFAHPCEAQLFAYYNLSSFPLCSLFLSSVWAQLVSLSSTWPSGQCLCLLPALTLPCDTLLASKLSLKFCHAKPGSWCQSINIAWKPARR